jgi:hypothetical protein
MRLSAVPAGWALEIDGVENRLFFQSGAQAEAAARRLGDRLVRAGGAAAVEIYMRGGGFDARLSCIENPASPPAGGEAPGRQAGA